MTRQGEFSGERAGDAPPHVESASGEVKAMSTGEQTALAAVRGELGPLSPDELAAYNSARAREMALANARREPSPQLDLEQAA